MTKSRRSDWSLSKNERIGIYLLMLILQTIILLPWLFQDQLKLSTLNPDKTQKQKQWTEMGKIASFDNRDSPSKETHVGLSVSDNKLERKAFDPNQLTAELAKQLGIPQSVYSNIQKYRNAGGRFTRKEQFKRIYGMTDFLYQELEPYLEMESQPYIAKGYTKSAVKSLSPIDVNQAEPEELEALPGIGTVLSQRITKYRTALGGFHNVRQICEVFGISDSLCIEILPFIKVLSKPLLLNINSADFSRLSKHPYIGFQQAKRILRYREQHATIASKEAFYQIKSLDSNWIEKVSPYLDFSPDTNFVK